MLVNVYSTYDNMLLFRGSPQEVVEEFDIGLSTVYKQIKSKKRRCFRRDFYCTLGDPIEHTVTDVYDCYTHELLNTYFNVQQASEECKMDFDVITKSCKGDMNRYTGSGLRFRKRIVGIPNKN